MRPMVIMRWFSQISLLDTALIGLRHRISLALSHISRKIGQFGYITACERTGSAAVSGVVSRKS